jgi:hypothetical protein
MPVLSAFGAGSARGFSPAASNVIVDGEYSYVFNGATSYLSTPSSSAFLPSGTSNWTIEMFIYVTGTVDSTEALFNVAMDSTYATGAMELAIESGTNKIIVYRPSSGFYASYKTTNGVAANQWVYVAASYGFTGTGGLRIWIDGNQEFTTNSGFSWGRTGVAQVGRRLSGANSNNFSGKISNLRWRVGTSVSSVSVPTSPLTNVSNTVLLTCQSSTIKDNSTANSGSPWTLTNNNSVTVSPTSPFYP